MQEDDGEEGHGVGFVRCIEIWVFEIKYESFGALELCQKEGSQCEYVMRLLDGQRICACLWFSLSSMRP